MEARVNVQQTLPDTYKAMYGITMSLSKTNLTPVQKELIKVRASQINRCAFCLDMHTKEALKMGETAQRIFLLNAWRETNLFSNEEKAILAITEEVTLINEQGLSDTVYKAAQNFFTEETIAQIIMSVVVINAWNRIAISTRLSIPG